jgi:phosphatidylserine/phosphatidylglycerophosphate/cardiolipin synthase-like enzyme
MMATRIANLVQTLSDRQMERLSEALSSGRISRNSALSTVEDITEVHGTSLQEFGAIIQKWEGTPANLGLCLASSIQLRKRLSAMNELVDVVWTGPVQFAVAARTTLATEREMIIAAKNQVTVVGYRVTEGARIIFDRLAEKSSEKVRVRLMLDEATAQLGILRRMWPMNQATPEVYENSESGLHAKVLAVDRRDVLVTSANLTHYGLESNIELGVRIRGETGLKIESLVDELIRNGQFRRVEF